MGEPLESFWLALWIVGLAGSSRACLSNKGRGPLGGMDCITIVWTARASVPSRINVKFQAGLMPINKLRSPIETTVGAPTGAL